MSKRKIRAQRADREAEKHLAEQPIDDTEVDLEDELDPVDYYSNPMPSDDKRQHIGPTNI